jgi:hypothetical protein
VFGRLLKDVRERVTWRLDELRWRCNEGDDEPDGDADDFESRLRRQRDRPGSRFYSQPAFAVLRGEDGSDPSGYDGDSGDAMARVVSALGEEPSRDAELGRPRVGDSSYGRGAAGWTAIVEWTLEAAAQGVVGLIATAPIIAAARRYKALKRRMEERGAQFLINRAGAALVALDDVVREAPSGSRLWLEAAEEMSSAAGRPLSELNYVGADSWLVFLVDIDRDLRYVRIVSPQGEITGRTTTSINELEKLYLPAPETT